MNKSENMVDDEGTTQEDARNLLENFCQNGFEDIEEAALVLGRPSEELTNFINGDEIIDDDLIMKLRGIAQEREIEID